MYYMYGKRPEDKQFRPLNGNGVRVSKKDAEVFQTKQEAEDFLNNILETRSVKDGCKVEIRNG